MASCCEINIYSVDINSKNCDNALFCYINYDVNRRYSWLLSLVCNEDSRKFS